MCQICIKYVKSKHLDDLKSGDIHLTPLQYFRNLEENGKNKTIGDKNEGHIMRHFNAHEIQKVKITTNNSEFDITKALRNGDNGYAINLSLAPEESKNWGISCYSILDIRDKDIFDVKERKHFSLLLNEISIWNIFIEKSSFANNLYNEVGGHNKIPIMILPSMFKKLKKFAIKHHYPISYGKVKYYDNEEKSNVDIYNDFNKQATSAAFRKNNRYSNQKEGRIVLYDDVNSFNNEINIGNLSSDIKEIKNQDKPRFLISTCIKRISINDEIIKYKTHRCYKCNEKLNSILK